MQITYGYYADEYGGKTIPEQDFQKAERQAEAYIRHLTYVKGDIFSVENDMVKDAACAAAEVYYKYNAQQQSGTPLVKSENNDGYSVTPPARQGRPRRRGAGSGIKVRQSWTLIGNFMRHTAVRLFCLFRRRRNAAEMCYTYK